MFTESHNLHLFWSVHSRSLIHRLYNISLGTYRTTSSSAHSTPPRPVVVAFPPTTTIKNIRTSWLLLVVVEGLLGNANVLATTTKGNQATTLSIQNAETETTSKRSLRAHKDTTNNADKEQVHPNKTRPVVDQLQQQKTQDGGKHVHKTAELLKHNAPPESLIVEKTTLVQKYMSIGSKRDKNPNVNPSVNIEMLKNDPAGWREYKKFWKPTN